MSDSNLIEFNSPTALVQATDGVSRKNSPGSNPFDEVLRKANGQEVFSFENIFNASLKYTDIDIGRESLPFTDVTNISGRESIGILNARESTNLIRITSPKNNGGGSPAIILSESQNSFCENEVFMKTLNTAFLVSHFPRSVSSSTSSFNSANPSFNIKSLNEPSKIFSLNNSSVSKINITSETLNDAFIQSNLSENLTKDLKCKEMTESGCRLRSESLPNCPTNLQLSPLRDNDVNLRNVVLREELKFRSAEKSKKSKFCTSTLEGKYLHYDIAEDEEFNDAVFIEARHLANKYADGSICEYDGDDLNNTSPPNFEVLEPQETSNGDVQVNSIEAVFKKVDKLVPDVTQDTSLSMRSRKSSSSSSGSLRTSLHDNLSRISNISGHSDSSSRKKLRDAKDIINNLSEILSSDHPSDSQKSEGQNLLSNLANIINEQLPSPERTQSEDSGHSSIDGDVFDLVESKVNSDAPKNTSEEAPEILDLSMKSKVTNSRKSRSFSTPSWKPGLPNKFNESFERPESFEMSKSKISNASCTSGERKLNDSSHNGSRISQNGSRISQNGSRISQNGSRISQNCSRISQNGSRISQNSQNSSKNSQNISFRPKKVSDNLGPLKKGPLKAVVPLESIVKYKGTRASSPKMPKLQSKRTSTPIKEPEMKPMAQSTPDARYIQPFSTDTSPKSSRGVFNRNSSSRCSIKRFSPASKAIETSKMLNRGNSYSDLPNRKSNANVVLRRSNSMGKDSTVLTDNKTKVVNSNLPQRRNTNFQKSNSSTSLPDTLKMQKGRLSFLSNKVPSLKKL